jgi:hypothetical protein
MRVRHDRDDLARRRPAPRQWLEQHGGRFHRHGHDGQLDRHHHDDGGFNRN